MFQINIFFSYKAYTVMLVHIMFPISYIPIMSLSCIHNIHSCKNTSPASLNTAVSPPNRNLLVEEQESIFCNVSHILLAFISIEYSTALQLKKTKHHSKSHYPPYFFFIAAIHSAPEEPTDPFNTRCGRTCYISVLLSRD